MSRFDVGALSRELESRLGLELEGSFEDIEGGEFATIRPVTPSKPNGFCILISRASRRVESSFRLDNQARYLLREMATSDEDDKALFCTLLSGDEGNEVSTEAIINNRKIASVADFPSNDWNDFVIECESRLPGIRVASNEAHAHALKTASTCLALVLCLLDVEPIDQLPSADLLGYPEGAKTRVEVNRYERNPVNRAACITFHGSVCKVCGFDFEHVYGELGKGYIHVHHITPVSEMSDEYRVNPVSDLVPLCPNCHAMVHKRTPPLSVEQLRDLMRS